MKQKKIEEDAEMVKKNENFSLLRETHSKKRANAKIQKTEKKGEYAAQQEEEKQKEIQNGKYRDK